MLSPSYKMRYSFLQFLCFRAACGFTIKDADGRAFTDMTWPFFANTSPKINALIAVFKNLLVPRNTRGEKHGTRFGNICRKGHLGKPSYKRLNDIKYGHVHLWFIESSVSQPPGRGPVPVPCINYTGLREVLLEFAILVF